jgi:outer membrane autotransporter protein
MQMHTLYDRQSEKLTVNNGGAWLRVVGGKADSKAASGQIDIDADYTLMHFGSDLVVFDDDKQQVQIGLMGSIGNGSTDAKGNTNLNGERKSADGSVDGYNLGLYATWIADAKEQKGAYVDSWLQHGWYDNDVTGEEMSSDSYDARLLTASVEAGYSFALNSENSTQNWRLTPQVQVAYSKYTADRFVDGSGTTIDGQNNDQWISRVGTRLSGKLQKEGYVIQPFGELNWWHNGKNTSVSLDNMSVEQDTKKDRAELKLGAQVEFTSNWNAWFNVGMQSDFSDYKRFEGTAGVRYTW